MAPHIYVTDLNGDGLPDVLQSDTGTTSIKLFYGNGNGSFNAPVSVIANTQPTAMLISDFNSDGVTDIVAVTRNGGTGVSLRSGTTTTALAPRLNINSQSGALDALTFLKTSLDRITLERGNIGAMQSRLSVAANVLGQRRQSYMEAASGILDVDVATEAANLVRSKILQQAGAAILGQANQAPALALVLLGGGRR